METLKICVTCGTQYPNIFKDDICKICSEERQFVPLTGQKWTNHEEIKSSYKNSIVKIKENLYEIIISPDFGIGQRALLIRTANGNILWDCIPLLDQITIDFINSIGGLKAIAFSHPHYYSNMNTWAEIFECPIYINKKDKPFVYFDANKIKYWENQELLLWENIKLINIGGHFEGSSVIIVPGLSEKGIMLTGDTIYLSLSKKHFSIMYSYPNRIPLSIKETQRIKNLFNNLEFDEIYGFYSYQNITKNAKSLLQQSLERYI